MSAGSQDQVAISQLLFGMSWEDPASDQRALSIKPGETLVTIGSGGCNSLTLLLDDPGKVYAVDINASQSSLLELKRRQSAVLTIRCCGNSSESMKRTIDGRHSVTYKVS